MRYKKIAIIVLSLIGFSWIHVVDSLGMEAYVSIEGESQGPITQGAGTADSVGNMWREGHEDESIVLSLGHSVTVPTDVQTGQPTGQRIHKPLRIVKFVDRATPLLLRALTTGEKLPNVEIKFYRTSVAGKMEHFYTIKLEDAIIVNISASLIPTATNNQMMETVSISYRKITWTHQIAGTEEFDDWRAPKS